MEYTPRYAQPFTLEEAIAFEVSVIVNEIARLENSLKHLRSTQELLQSCLVDAQEPDVEISRAFDENKVVIESQEERISILKIALTEKGIQSGAHYDAKSGTNTPELGLLLSSHIRPAETVTSEDGVFL